MSESSDESQAELLMEMSDVGKDPKWISSMGMVLMMVNRLSH